MALTQSQTCVADPLPNNTLVALSLRSTMTTPLPGVHADEQAFLDSVEGEISFFRSIMRARPLGKHRHFHILTVRNSILRDTGRSVDIGSIWEKLRKCYNIDALEAAEAEPENLTSGTSTTAAASASSAIPAPLRSLSPSENLALHPHFAEEFSLPYEDFESLFAQRRMRETASLPSSPAPTPGTMEGAAKPVNVAGGNATSRHPSASSSTAPIPVVTTTRTGKRKIGKSKLNLAGLVGGDSDSSALTQESGDEGGEDEGSGVGETPKESVVTWTGTGTDADGRTEDGEEEDTEMREASSIRESPRPTRGRGAKAAGRRGRGAASNTRGSSRGKKKQKR